MNSFIFAIRANHDYGIADAGLAGTLLQIPQTPQRLRRQEDPSVGRGFSQIVKSTTADLFIVNLPWLISSLYALTYT